jgi:hypothetical protein
MTLILIAGAICFAATSDLSEKPTVVVVVGAPGEPEFGEQFHEWAERWRLAAEKGGAELVRIGDSKTADDTDRGRLQKAIVAAAREKTAPLWLVMIGHGTYDGRAAKFNLRGRDVEAAELAEWLGAVRRPIAVINCASSSAPFINRLSGENRIVISATKSGDERNFARFGQFISSAIGDPSSDLDKDGQVSLLEAYLTACRQLDEFYASDARLATEHPLLDDNGDSLGTPAAWFRGLRATRRAKEGATLDGTRAHQLHLIASDREQRMPAELRQKRDELELKIAALRTEKESMGDDEYYRRLEKLMLELARLYAKVDGEPKSD